MATKTPPDAVDETLATGSRTSNSLNPGGGSFIARVRGTFVANIRLQMSRDEGSNWDDVFTFTAADVLHFDSIPGELYRLSMAGSGDFTSGTSAVYLGR